MTFATPPGLPGDLLSSALQQDPSRPLLTFYDDMTGERVELSVATFANWVAKTANFLQDGLGAAPGLRVNIRLPAHWQSAVWLCACWAFGAVPVVGQDGAPAEVAVIAADDAEPPPPADELVVLGLGPLGLPRATQEPAAAARPPAVDYDREIHTHGDHFPAPAALADQQAAIEIGRSTLSASDLRAQMEGAQQIWQLQRGDRVLGAGALDTLPAILAIVLLPLATGAGAVICRNLNSARVAERVAAERVVGVLRGGTSLQSASSPGFVPSYLADLPPQ